MNPSEGSEDESQLPQYLPPLELLLCCPAIPLLPPARPLHCGSIIRRQEAGALNEAHRKLRAGPALLPRAGKTTTHLQLYEAFDVTWTAGKFGQVLERPGPLDVNMNMYSYRGHLGREWRKRRTIELHPMAPDCPCAQVTAYKCRKCRKTDRHDIVTPPPY